MNKITKNTICPNSKIKKSIFIIQNRIISEQINEVFEILGLFCFAFTALAIDNFLPNKIEIVSMYFLTKNLEQMRPKIRENLRKAYFNPKFTGY